MKDIFGNNNYRFGVESFLLMFLSKYQFVLGADLEHYTLNQQVFDENNPCNIYFVLRRPKVTVNPASIKVQGKKVKFQLLIHIKDKASIVDMRLDFPKAESKIECLTEYPYNVLTFRDQKKLIAVARTSVLIDSNLIVNNIEIQDLDYEVLYIGQSYGQNGKRTALDRLSSHETIQKIYAHSSSHYPNSDIWIMLANFSQQSMLVMAGADLIKVNEEDSKVESEKIKHMSKNNGILISERQRINFTEAALIKYFEPQYNKYFKDSFPSLKHKSYSECYDLDVKALTIELDTSEMARNIYTSKSGRKEHHLEMFEFNSDQDRVSLLEALE